MSQNIIPQLENVVSVGDDMIKPSSAGFESISDPISRLEQVPLADCKTRLTYDSKDQLLSKGHSPLSALGSALQSIQFELLTIATSVEFPVFFSDLGRVDERSNNEEDSSVFKTWPAASALKSAKARPTKTKPELNADWLRLFSGDS